MIKPTPADLLQGVADALAETVLPTMDRGPARNQVQAAVGIVGRCASALDRYGPVLYADGCDLMATLGSVAAADPGVVLEARAGHDLESALTRASTVLDGPYPPISELLEIGLELRAHLASIAVQAQQQQSGQLPTLRALFDRMIEREQDLGLSPW